MSVTLLPLNQVDRSYKPEDEMYDTASSDFIARRRLTQHELHMKWGLYVLTTNVYDPEFRPLLDDIDMICSYAAHSLDIQRDWRTEEEREQFETRVKRAINRITEKRGVLTLTDEVNEIRFGEAQDCVLTGLLAGQRMGLRLGMGLMARIMMGKGAESPLTGLPANEATALIAGAQVDDTMADRLIGWLLTGHEPEFLHATPIAEERGDRE
ncbi:MAG TPA: hypothetical protein VNT01_10175 [Symbiobacteriaceae bacterium]|nr:hypothetical protein [Symbiobacteriaceae bacterium]